MDDYYSHGQFHESGFTPGATHSARLIPLTILKYCIISGTMRMTIRKPGISV
jgi:hypothetical protein